MRTWWYSPWPTSLHFPCHLHRQTLFNQILWNWIPIQGGFYFGCWFPISISTVRTLFWNFPYFMLFVGKKMNLRNFDAALFFLDTTATKAINPSLCNSSSGKLWMENQLKMEKNTTSWYKLGKIVVGVGSFKGILHLNPSTSFPHYLQQPRRRAKR